MNKINSYKDLFVWQKGMEIVKEVYLLSAGFPKEEIFGITSQIRRAATSIPLNIAEGYARSTSKSYKNFLRYSRASAQEAETAMMIAIMLNFIKEDDCSALKNLLVEESKMLNSLINKIKE